MAFQGCCIYICLESSALPSSVSDSLKRDIVAHGGVVVNSLSGTDDRASQAVTHIILHSTAQPEYSEFTNITSPFSSASLCSIVWVYACIEACTVMHTSHDLYRPFKSPEQFPLQGAKELGSITVSGFIGTDRNCVSNLLLAAGFTFDKELRYGLGHDQTAVVITPINGNNDGKTFVSKKVQVAMENTIPVVHRGWLIDCLLRAEVVDPDLIRNDEENGKYRANRQPGSNINIVNDTLVFDKEDGMDGGVGVDEGEEKEKAHGMHVVVDSQEPECGGDEEENPVSNSVQSPQEVEIYPREDDPAALDDSDNGEQPTPSPSQLLNLQPAVNVAAVFPDVVLKRSKKDENRVKRKKGGVDDAPRGVVPYPDEVDDKDGQATAKKAKKSSNGRKSNGRKSLKPAKLSKIRMVDDQKPKVVALSGLHSSEQKQIIENLCDIPNVTVVAKTHAWATEYTHVLAPSLLRNQKCLAALASGGTWLLRAEDYAKACKREGRLVDEEQYELDAPKSDSVGGFSIERGIATFWRTQTRSKGAFQGLTFALARKMDRKPSRDDIIAIITAGNGVLVPLSGRGGGKVSSNTTPDVVICGSSDNDAVASAAVQKHVKNGALCVSSAFIVDWLAQPSMDLTCHVLQLGAAVSQHKVMIRARNRGRNMSQDITGYLSDGSVSM